MKAGDLIAGRFEIDRFVARGGMGEVFRALDRETGAPVAVKLLTTSSRKYARRLAREARALLALNHPGIVRHVAHEADPDIAGSLFVAMEWIEGVTLSERIKQTPLTIEESLVVALRAAEALGAAHRQGMVHRDIKPRNILIEAGELERVKLLDFGLVRMTDQPNLTATGVGMGTPGYMAPEQARGDRAIGPAADVFSLGCVLFRCLTGLPPFRGKRVEAVLAKIAMFDEAPRVAVHRPDVPVSIDDLVARMMARSPDARPQCGEDAAQAVVAELTRLRLGRAPTAEVALPPALTTRELAPVAVVFADLGGDGKRRRLATGKPAARATLVDGGSCDLSAMMPSLRRALAAYDAHVEMLVHGAVVAMVTGGGAATDLAVRAARCAVALRAWLPDAAIAIASGHADADDHSALDPIIDRAAQLMQRPSDIIVDDATRALLASRYDTEPIDGGYRIARERELTARAESPRMLLGRSPPCVGRARVLRQLEAIAGGAIDEREADAVVLVGEAGVGKSRVVTELLRRLRASHPTLRVLSASGDPMRAAVPRRVVSRGLSQYLALPTRTRADLARALEPVAIEDRAWIADLLGELVGIRADDAGPGLRAARADPVVMAQQLRDAWSEWIAAEAGSHPLLIVVDDLQWADTASIELLGAGLRRARDLPVLLLAVGRPGVRERFPALADMWSRQEIHIDALRPAACAELVRAALPDVDAQTCNRIVERSAGNAFYLEELIRAAAADAGEALPASVLASVQVRIGRLPERARQVLRAASVFGRQVPTEAIPAMLGADVHRADVRHALETLEDEELIRTRPVQREHEFTHDLVRDAAYAMLTPADRKTGHRLAGQWLQSEPGVDPIVLAEHFAGGGAIEQAVEWFERAATDALGSAAPTAEAAALLEAAGHLRRAGTIAAEAYDNDGALRVLTRAAALFEPLDPLRAAVTLLDVSEVRTRVNQHERALADVARAEQLASRASGDASLEIDLLLRRAEVLIGETQAGALGRAREAARHARELAARRNDRHREARAWTQLAIVFGRYDTPSDSDRAIRCAERALALEQDDRAVRWSLWRLGNAFLRRDDRDRAESMYCEALRASEAANDEACVAECLGNLAIVAFRQWRIAAAVERAERAKRIYERLGYRHRARNMRVNLGTFHAYLGDRARAYELLELAVLQSRGDWDPRTAALELLAALDRDGGDEDRAQQRLLEAANVCRVVEVPQREAVFLGLLAESQWASGHYADALESLSHAVEHCERFTLSHALILVRLGRYAQATAWLERAHTDEPDPDRRLYAQLALARVKLWTGDAAAARPLADSAFEIADKAGVSKLAVPAAALARCIDGNINGAIARFKTGSARCGGPVFADMAVDVGTLLAAAADAPAQAVATYLELAPTVRDRSLAFRIHDICAALYLRTGAAAAARTCTQRARAALEDLADQLPPEQRDMLAAHPWARSARGLKLV